MTGVSSCLAWTKLALTQKNLENERLHDVVHEKIIELPDH